MESTSPAQLDTVSQPEAPAASRYSLRWLFFPLALLYHELLLRAFDSSTVFFDAALVPTALTALGLGLLISLLAACAPSGTMVTQLAQVYGGDSEYAGAVNVLSTLGCIVTMPLLVALYQL